MSTPSIASFLEKLMQDKLANQKPDVVKQIEPEIKPA